MKKTAKKVPGPNMVKVHNYTLDLPCRLTEDEVAKVAQEAARLLEERDHKEEEAKEEAKRGTRRREESWT